MIINTNVSSLTAQGASSQTNKTLASSLEKLSTGLRINKAADDASGMSIADKLRTQASSIGQGISNANSASALIQIADKAMAEQSNILDTIKTKLIQAATDTTSAEGREAIREDIKTLLTQLDDIAVQTNYNGENLLDTKGKELSFQVGEDKSYDISTKLAYSVNTVGLGGGSTTYTAGGPDLTLSEEAITVKNQQGSSREITMTAASAAGEDVIFTINGQDITSTTTTVADTHADAVVTAIQAKIDDGTLTNISVHAEGAVVKISNTDNDVLDIVEKTDGSSSAALNTVTNAVAINSDVTTLAEHDVTFTVDAKKATAVTLKSSTAGSVVITTSNQAAIDKLNTIAGTHTTAGTTGLVKNQDGNYTFTQSTAGTAAVLDLGSNGFDLSAVTFSGVSRDATIGGNEMIIIKTDESVTVTNESTADIGIESANGTTLTANNLVGGEMLSGLKNLKEDGLTAEKANDFMVTIDKALTQLNSVRAGFGSTQNQIQSSIRNMTTTQTNLKAAESVIRDVDYAQESANFNKQNIIAQAGTYAISQANSMQQNVLRLLQ